MSNNWVALGGPPGEPGPGPKPGPPPLNGHCLVILFNSAISSSKVGSAFSISLFEISFDKIAAENYF